MVTMSEQYKETNILTTVPSDDVKGNKNKSVVLSTSDYSAIYIESPDTANSDFHSKNTGTGLIHTGATRRVSRVNYNTTLCQSAPLRRRHSSITSVSSQTKRKPVPYRTPSFDASRIRDNNPSSHKLPNYNGLTKNNMEIHHQRPPSGRINYTRSFKPDLDAGSSHGDGVSIISAGGDCGDSVEEVSPHNFECNDRKVQKETLALKQLIKLSITRGSTCSKTKEDSGNKSFLCGWCESRPSTGTKSSTSVLKKRSSPAVFNRLIRDDRENIFVFTHYKKSSEHMSQYRVQHTVGGTGDLARVPVVIGRDVPDPYAMKPSNVCSIDLNVLRVKSSLLTEMSAINPSSFGLMGNNKAAEDCTKRGCPNLSQACASHSPNSKEMDRATPCQHIISVNEIMDAYLPQATLPHIQTRPNSKSSTCGARSHNGVADSVSSSVQFDGEIVGMKHQLPTATTCNLSALCKPSADADVYGGLRSSSNTYRSSNIIRHKSNQSTASQSSSSSSSSSTNMAKTVTANPEYEPEVGDRMHSEKGCRGCHRIASLIRGTRKNNVNDAKTKHQTFGQCKPYEEQYSTHYRLQKIPMG